ncbi:OSTA/TMEM184 family protein [Aspergillus clavatus NRRL 1]|uniref:DUF300 domain protein, putative n=1 Tax=Aspergillus clavatus (strain ATCC 1007 / CBS 513.65 / DSM 816 / NCTC 3887 / NRRL 1 / QM 1276 / 107) TaxID=344612 RepID=A1CA56_ASPCL|nr:DUF300 domain protein, putative [Aspergillus clavatus NRRL 1]EAW12624.1 DUF300 domain protein, putative [Aspergillus clavatus NRRL 1]
MRTVAEVDLWDGGLTFHELCLIVGGAFAILAATISIYLIMCHATHYSKPIEQRHIIRILWMIPIYSLVAWLSTYFYKSAIYYELIGNSYEAFTISAFFALLCHYIAPDLHSQKEYFRGITPKQWLWPVPWFQKCCGGEKGIWRIPRSGLTWFNVVWVGVFQYCLLRVLSTIIAVVTQHFDVYCEESLSPAFSHVWVLAIECVAVSIAMYCLIQFYYQVKEDISQYSPFLKIASIKLVIFLSFWQTTLISFLFSSGAIKPTEKIQEPDLKVGLPNLLISVEMAIFAVLHLWAFSWKPYYLKDSQPDEVTDFYGNGKGLYHGGRWGMKALVDSFNPLDLLKAVGRSVRWLFVGRKKRMMDPSYQSQSEAIGLENAGTGANANMTAYQGAGATLAGGRTRPYGTSPDDEDQVLLSHAQPNPTSRLTGDLGIAPPPYQYDHDARLYSHHDDLSDASLLDPAASHSPQAYSPYEDPHRNPYMASGLIDDPYHHQINVSSTGQGAAVHNQYPQESLREQPPIPMPDPYQSPPSHHNAEHSRR